MSRPLTRIAAHAAWRAQSLRILCDLGVELAAVESLVRAGVTGPRLDATVEGAWDRAGRIAAISLGPEVSLEEIKPNAQAAR